MNKYTRTYNYFQKKETLYPIEIEVVYTESKIWIAFWFGVLGLIAAILFLHVHNSNRLVSQQNQQLTVNPPHQVMVQNAAQGNLIQ